MGSALLQLVMVLDVLVVLVAAAPTGMLVAEVTNATSTSISIVKTHTMSAVQKSVIGLSTTSPTPTPVFGFIYNGSSRSASVMPTDVLVSDATTSALQQLGPLPSPATSSFVPVYVFTADGDSTLSTRVIMAIIVGFFIFLTLHVVLFCFWRRLGCCRRHPQASQGPPLPHTHARVAFNIAHPGPNPSRPRPSSASTLVSANGSQSPKDGNDDTSVRDSVVDVPSLQMLPMARQSSPVRHSRPRVPLMEGAV
ncbi:hypothetical protein C8R43DRAFT_190546 [Mycena crocata]|nr:hypothetical protein C8R43DRAFT_190546 [Mycena crocata]